MDWSWLSQFLQMFADIVPRPLIVRTDERVVEFRFGKWPRSLLPGWYIEWPFFAKYAHVATARQVTSREQRFGIKAYRWKVVYEVHDALALVCHTYDFDETIADFCEIAFSETSAKLDDPTTEEARSGVLCRIRGDLIFYGVTVIEFAVVSSSIADFQLSVWELNPPAL